MQCSFTASAHLETRLTAILQDNYRTRSRRIGGRLWWHHQLEPIRLLPPIRLHDQDLAAAVAHIHRVSHNETEVCDSTRPILLLSVWQRH
jgi:hypothetical protein